MVRSPVTNLELLNSLRAGNSIIGTMRKYKVGYMRMAEVLREIALSGEVIQRKSVRKRKLTNEKYFNRSTKDGWIGYMLNNPYYFQDIFNVVFSPEAVRRVAEIQFKVQVCSCCGNIMPRIKCCPGGE